MIRISGGYTTKKKRKKFLKLAKGYSTLNYSEQVIQALQNAFVGRKLKKRRIRSFWISRINSIIRMYNISYSIFLGILRKFNILLNRKILAFLGYYDPIFIHYLFVLYIF
jgi:large subunit ribosomal protein L20